jgi:hypothetical protein
MLNAAGKQVPVAEQSMYESIANELGLTASDRVAHIKEMPPEQQNTAMSQAVDDELFARLEAMGIQVPLSVIEDARARGASTAVDSFMQGKYGNLDKSADNIINTINSTDQANTLKDEAFFNSALEDDLDNSNKGLQNAAINSRRNVDRLMKDEAPETESASYEQPIDENVSRLDSFGMPQHVKEFVGEGGGQAYFIQKPRDNADTPVPFSEIGSMDKSMSPENANSDTQGTWVIDDGEDLWELDHFDPSSMMDVRDPERASMLRKAIKLGLATPF